ncbi:Multidrug resistance-associated protein 5 [Trichoplax sp. H2]|nr:Multidrug resistance-associated protein 5 [Trichoplax sp. H2]|eukprot:RDD46633.1 Multidrug resistance-associated protein 5 [Trichoplax sp. H2]
MKSLFPTNLLLLYHVLTLLSHYPILVQTRVAPYARANFWQLLTLSWMTPLVWLGYKRPIEMEDLGHLPAVDSFDANINQFQILWDKEVAAHGIEKASLGRVLFLLVRKKLLKTFLIYCLVLTCTVLGPVIIHRLIQYTEGQNKDVVVGSILVVCIFINESIKSLTFAFTWYLSVRAGVQIRSMALALIYNKLLKLKYTSKSSIGELTNLYANDAQRMFEAVLYFAFISGAPIIPLCALIYLTSIVGPAAIVGCVTFVLFYPILIGVARYISKLRRSTIGVTDKRVSAILSVPPNLTLKLIFTSDSVNERDFDQYQTNQDECLGISTNPKGKRYMHKQTETERLSKAALTQSLSISAMPIVPVIASIITIITAFGLGTGLKSSQAFAVVSMFNAMRFTMTTLPTGMKAVAEANIALGRIKNLLVLNEYEKCIERSGDDDTAIHITDGTFAWTKTESDKKGRRRSSVWGRPVTVHDAKRLPVLFDINLAIKKNIITGICGHTGSGKSSLIAAILGEMHVCSGESHVTGTIGYVPQQPWVMNATIKDNILFGVPLDEQRYDQVLSDCSLVDDLRLLPEGDETILGDRGVNLSGGQRQRISLARALYADKDIYLLDDPLSGVDLDVGNHIFASCIQRSMAGKTVVLVSHQMQYIKQCDHILVMENGMIVEQGKDSNLLEKRGAYYDMLTLFGTDIDKIERTDEVIATKKPSYLETERLSFNTGQTLRANQKRGRTFTVESRLKGHVSAASYRMYIKCAGGYFKSFIVIMMFALSIGAKVFNDYWLSEWIRSGFTVNNTLQESDNEFSNGTSTITFQQPLMYLLVYCSAAVFMIILLCFKGLTFTKATLRASTRIHNQVLEAIMQSSMTFFTSTPGGRILNRFSRDMDDVDIRLPMFTELILQNIFLIIFSLGVIISIFPWFLLALIPLVVIFIIINVIFKGSLREVKRLDNRSRSPVISHLSATIAGITTIHAFDKTENFLDRFRKLVDKNSTTFVTFHCLHRWLAVRLDFVVTTFVTITAIFVVAQPNDATRAGLALSYAFQLTGMFQYTVRNAAEAEARFTSVERLRDYVVNTENEGKRHTKLIQLPKKWPFEGQVTFHQVQMRYHPDLPLVLHDMDFHIRAGEKVGIIGRTGSGKSSIGACMYRLVEVESGKIIVDGVNISMLGLDDLRSNLCIIPQDPLLFSGTLRKNLDPFDEHSDEEVWDVLEKVNLKTKFERLTHRLYTAIKENGNNFSVGERQLLCLARTLLRRGKIVILDEATASMDSETDKLIQDTIKNEFLDSTLLIVAHRLQTVMACDRILIVHEGRAVEFDEPQKLIENSQLKLNEIIDNQETAPILNGNLAMQTIPVPNHNANHPEA